MSDWERGYDGHTHIHKPSGIEVRTLFGFLNSKREYQVRVSFSRLSDAKRFAERSAEGASTATPGRGDRRAA